MPHPLLLDTTVSAPAAQAWFFALPVVLGAIGVYLLLPRPGRYSPWWGASLAGLAVVAAGFLLVHPNGAVVETILFYAFSAIAVVGGGLLVTQRNPVKAALSFALVVLSTCGLFLLQAAPFLMAATIIIYAGAILVTFLFVIMLAQQAGLSGADARSREPLLSCLAGFLLLGTLLFVLRTTYTNPELDELLQRTERASRQSSPEAMQEALGDKREFFERSQHAVERVTVASTTARQMRAALDHLQNEWKGRDTDAAHLKLALAKLHDTCVQVRNGLGSLQPPPGIPRSPFSQAGTRPSNPGDEDVAPLPKENVDYLGRTLFTDYLLAVELGGTLLLVAAIGAIAITARRAEGLR
jgi:NADH:ubiquinone oxidoreductase subunit 6 (subunit J)